MEQGVLLIEKLRAPGASGSYGDHIRRQAAAQGVRANDGSGGLNALPLPAELQECKQGVREEILYRVSYAGYLQREVRQVEKFSELEKIRIPSELDYSTIKGLRTECAQKLARFKPFTLGQASRISGLTPADISILLILIESKRKA